MGLDGFEFVEFASPKSRIFETVFKMLGFEIITYHRSKDVFLYRQGKINFIINKETNNLISCWDLLKKHVVPFMTANQTPILRFWKNDFQGMGNLLEDLKTRGIVLDG